MRWIRWLAVVAMFAVGIGAMYVSTVGLGDTQAATAQYLTQLARRTTVSDVSAATGTVASAASYSLVFGEDARLAASTDAAAATTSWTVADVMVSVGDRVTAGQPLARAATDDLEAQDPQASTSLALARITLSEAEKALANARSALQAQLIDARSAADTAKLSLTNAKVQRTDAAAGSPKRQARIGAIQAQDQLRQARRTVVDLQKQLRGDLPAETIARGEAEQAVVDLEQQLADLTTQLEHATLVAPVDGVVAQVNIKPSFLAPSGSSIVIDGATLDVVADVVESDVSSLAVGQTATVSIDALGLDVLGTVTSIAPTTAAGTSSVVTFPVTVTLIEPGTSVKPGMSADVQITTAEAADVVAVPSVALRGSGGAYTVDVLLADGGVETRPVSVGLVTETLAEVQSGLAEGDLVVVGSSADRVTSEAQSGFGGPGFGGPSLGGGFRTFEGGGRGGD